jgi:hypothetical protein
MASQLINETYDETLLTGWSKTYNVPEGKTLMFLEWTVGIQKAKASSLTAALIWDENGDGKKLTYIDKFFTQKRTYRRVLSTGSTLTTPRFTSNGKSRVIVRRHIFGVHTPREIIANWKAQMI